MTAAERMREHRARKKRATAEPATAEGSVLLKMLPTDKKQARYLGMSVRSYYHIKKFNRCRAFDWDGDILNGKYGRCGISFLAEVCAVATPDLQRQIHDLIKSDGAAFARNVWKMLKADHARQE